MRKVLQIFLICIGLVRCEMDDQPRKSPLQKSELFSNGASAREPVVHSVLHTPPTNAKPAQKKGQRNFEAYCSPCHGNRGLGDGRVIARGFPAPAAFEELRIQSQSRTELVDTILRGKGNSPAFEGVMSKTDATEIAEYIHTLSMSEKSTPPAEER